MKEIQFMEVVVRISLAMFVGFIVGGQRAWMSHSAGIRTHMLVCVSACVVTMTGIMAFYYANTNFGGTPDPARLPAQVINGVGFLGTGTILKDTFSVRGLTSAASLWVTACVGIASGFGCYTLALLAVGAIFCTLVVVQGAWERASLGKGSQLRIYMECEGMAEVLLEFDKLVKLYQIQVHTLSFDQTKRNTYTISCQVIFPKKNWTEIQSEFLQTLALTPGLIELGELQC